MRKDVALLYKPLIVATNGLRGAEVYPSRGRAPGAMLRVQAEDRGAPLSLTFPHWFYGELSEYLAERSWELVWLRRRTREGCSVCVYDEGNREFDVTTDALQPDCLIDRSLLREVVDVLSRIPSRGRRRPAGRKSARSRN